MDKIKEYLSPSKPETSQTRTSVYLLLVRVDLEPPDKRSASQEVPEAFLSEAYESADTPDQQ